MAIVDSLLIQDSSLQEYLVDKTTGEPLAGGFVYFWEDTSRLTPKPVYVQTGSPGSYTYVQLPNPLVLSSVGTTEYLGQDIKIFYYPYEVSSTSQNPPAQPYYVQVFNADNEDQFTRENWPFLGAGANPDEAVPDLNNLVINNEFWRNVGTASNPATGAILAPSQHDGFQFSDITYQKNGTGETEVISFPRFPDGSQSLTDDVTPEFYLDFNCTVAGSSTTKFIYIPLSLHLLTLGSFPGASITIQAKNIAGTGTLDLYILADRGTGVAPVAPTLIDQISVNNSWVKYQTATFTFPPSVSQATLGAGGDDGFYLVVGVPVGVTHIQFAKPSVYLSEDVPTNNFQTYDEIDAVINSPRTGDVRTSLNNFVPFGWVAANDSTIGDTNQQTWQLYNLLWNTVSDTFAPVATGRGVSAYADFSASKAMTLPLMLGRVLMGLPINQTTTYNHLNSEFTVTDANLYYFGTPIILTTTGTLPDAFTANTVYYAFPINATTFSLAATPALAYARTAVAAGTTDGTGMLTINVQIAGNVGQAAHTPTLAELFAHNHAGSTIGYLGVGPAADPPASILTRDIPPEGTTANGLNIATAGSSLAANVVQPSIYMNVFLKL